MAKKKLPIRIFISSPGDVIQERNLAFQIIEQLKYERRIKGQISIELIAWDKPGEETPFLATMTPQEAINKNRPKPSQCDIVIVIFWSRMGTPLPYPEYQKPDNTPYVSGTEWEFLDAFNASKKSGKPQLIVYRRDERIYISPSEADFLEKSEQWKLVDDFFKSFANPDGSIGKGYHRYGTVEHFQQLLETHLRQLIQAILKQSSESDYLPSSVEEEIWSTSPFPGLRAFTEKDAPIFFGRTKETHDLIKRLEETPFMAVIGASGSGKSSLVGAGVVAQLKKNAIEGSKNWVYLRLSPGETGANPFVALTTKLKPEMANPLDPVELAEILEKEPAKIKDVCQNALKGKHKWTKLFIFIDQFEELFTLVERQYIESFISTLEAALTSKRVRIVITLRSDFYHQCVANLTLGRWLQEGSYPLPIPKKFSLIQMITRPSQRAALAFEEGLPEQIVNDTGEEAGALALMAYTLDELYHNRSETGQLTFEIYNKIGKVQGAIGERAEKAFQALSAESQNYFTRVFRELVEVDERGVTTRRRTSSQEIVGGYSGAQDLVNAFVEARLLVSDRDTIEVAHEALLKSWKTLAQWIEERQGDLRLLKQIREAAKEWSSKDKRKDYLWSHERLVPVYLMLERLELQPEALLKEFIKPEYERLFEELNDPNTYDYRRQAIGDRLAQIGEPALNVLIQTFHNKDKWLRAVAVRSLIQIGATAIPYLEPILLTSKELQVRRRVLRILGAIGINGIPSLMKVLYQTGETSRGELTETIFTIVERTGGVSNKELTHLRKNLTSKDVGLPTIKNHLSSILKQIGAVEIDEALKQIEVAPKAKVQDDPLGGIDPLTWLESLAARQGATEGFITAHNVEIPEIDSNSVVIDEPGYTPSESFSHKREAAPPPIAEIPAWLAEETSLPGFDLDATKPSSALVIEEAIPATHTQDEILASIEGLSDEQIARMQIAGSLTPVQELAWLQRQAMKLAKQRELFASEEALLSDMELKPAAALEIPSWLQHAVIVDKQEEPLLDWLYPPYELFASEEALLSDMELEQAEALEIPTWLQNVGIVHEEEEPLPDWLYPPYYDEDTDIENIMKRIIDDHEAMIAR